MISIIGSGIGFSISVLFESDSTGFSGLFFATILTNLGSGLLVNRTTNQYSLFLTSISPLRYGSEIMLRRILSKDASHDVVLGLLNLNGGDKYCFACLVLIFGVTMTLGLIVAKLKDKKVF